MIESDDRPSYQRPQLERETHFLVQIQCVAHNISPDDTRAVLAIAQHSIDERERPLKLPQ